MMRREIPGLAAALAGDIYEHAFGATDREVGGVLVGTTRPGAPPTINGSVRALNATESAAQLTFTQDAWEHIHSVMARDYPSLEIVGWYHTHPGYGLFLSEQDMFIQRNFFQNHSQIALVIDPVAREEAVFAWYGTEIKELGRRPCAPTPAAVAVDRVGRADRLPPPRSTAPNIRLTSAKIESRIGRPTIVSGIYAAAIALSLVTVFWELFLR